MKKILALATVALFAGFVFSLALAEDEKPATPKKAENNKENISIDDISKSWEAAPLTHWKHQDDYKVDGKAITCKDCHHEAEKEDGSDAKSCFSCHKKDDTEKDGKKIIKLKNAYHKQCKNCHKKANKAAGNKKAPTKCKACHAKKKKK